MQEAICAAFAKINKTCMPPQDSTGDCYGEKKVKWYGPGPSLTILKQKIFLLVRWEAANFV